MIIESLLSIGLIIFYFALLYSVSHCRKIIKERNNFLEKYDLVQEFIEFEEQQKQLKKDL